ncbi:MAG: spermidine synthase [Streptomyces sp.]|nr:spermidine synthase [Streptomyces sp.]
MLGDDTVAVLDRRDGVAGELALRHRGGSGGGDGGTYEIIANGCFLMDTSDGRSERLLVDAALDALGPGRDAPGVLLGGLGVGFSLARAAATGWGRIEVVEREAAVVAWHRDGPLAEFSAGALDDPRVSLVVDDLLDHLRGPGEPFDALCLDIDNGPDWTVTENNGSLYSPSGLDACRNRLTPGGVLAVWSAQPSAAFEDALRSAGFERVHTLEIPVARGVPDVVHLAHRTAEGRRRA